MTGKGGPGGQWPVRMRAKKRAPEGTLEGLAQRGGPQEERRPMSMTVAVLEPPESQTSTEVLPAPLPAYRPVYGSAVNFLLSITRAENFERIKKEAGYGGKLSQY